MEAKPCGLRSRSGLGPDVQGADRAWVKPDAKTFEAFARSA
jgi:hypothetical protein